MKILIPPAGHHTVELLYGDGKPVFTAPPYILQLIVCFAVVTKARNDT
jgi:hypothetical protein